MFISFGGGTDIIKDRDTGFVIHPEITDHTSTAADHVQPHQVGIVLIFAECRKDISHILSGNSCNTIQIWGGDIRCFEAQNLLYCGFFNLYTEPVEDGILCGNQALVNPEFLCPATAFLSFFIVDVQDVHGSVPDISK